MTVGVVAIHEDSVGVGKDVVITEGAGVAVFSIVVVAVIVVVLSKHLLLPWH